MKEREREAQAREKEAVRRHELEMKQLEVQAVNTDGGVSEHHSGIAIAKMPKLPQFIDGQDDLDSYKGSNKGSNASRKAINGTSRFVRRR